MCMPHAGAERLLGHHVAALRCTAVPRSMSRRLAETIATRTWSARWISLGPVVDDDVGDRVQRDRPRAARIDDQAADALDRSAVGFLRAHQHVDLAVAEAVARGDFAAHLLHHHVGDLARGQAQRTRRDPGRSGSGFPGSPAPPSTSRRRSADSCAAAPPCCWPARSMLVQVRAAQFDFQRRARS